MVQRMFSIRELKKLMNETYNWEEFAKFLEHNATLLLDFNDDIAIEREKHFEYKGAYWYYTREKGEVTKVGYESVKSPVVQHWQDRGFQFVVKTERKPLGTVNSNVHYIIADK